MIEFVLRAFLDFLLLIFSTVYDVFSTYGIQIALTVALGWMIHDTHTKNRRRAQERKRKARRRRAEREAAFYDICAESDVDAQPEPSIR